jgi:5-formyltetrahydrofolate cyclo-ligase
MKGREAFGSKAELRSHFRQLRRQSLPAAEPGLQRAAASLAEQLQGDQHLGIYWPLAGEADLRPLAQQPGLAQRLALPRVAGGQLSYRGWTAGDVLEPDDTQIPAPRLGPDLEPGALGLLLVPALAVDRRGIRLGYGGGWFDRLRSNPSWAAVPALTVLPAACLVDELPADPWDVPFSGWIDEQGLHWLQGV